MILQTRVSPLVVHGSHVADAGYHSLAEPGSAVHLLHTPPAHVRVPGEHRTIESGPASPRLAHGSTAPSVVHVCDWIVVPPSPDGSVMTGSPLGGGVLAAEHATRLNADAQTASARHERRGVSNMVSPAGAAVVEVLKPRRQKRFIEACTCGRSFR